VKHITPSAEAVRAGNERSIIPNGVGDGVAAERPPTGDGVRPD